MQFVKIVKTENFNGGTSSKTAWRVEWVNPAGRPYPVLGQFKTKKEAIEYASMIEEKEKTETRYDDDRVRTLQITLKGTKTMKTEIKITKQFVTGWLSGFIVTDSFPVPEHKALESLEFCLNQNAIGNTVKTYSGATAKILNVELVTSI